VPVNSSLELYPIFKYDVRASWSVRWLRVPPAFPADAVMSARGQAVLSCPFLISSRLDAIAHTGRATSTR
jgi:hypothetical protein